MVSRGGECDVSRKGRRMHVRQAKATRHTGFAPSSFSGGRGSSSPSPFRGGGRGKPRGGASSPFTPSRNSPDIRPGNENNSGSATPHYGVGFGGGGRGRGRGAWNPIASAMRGRGTGRMRGIMGDLEAADLRNMMAPVFVKAGTLFTEDEPEGDPIQDSHLVRESGVQEVIDLTGELSLGFGFAIAVH